MSKRRLDMVQKLHFCTSNYPSVGMVVSASSAVTWSFSGHSSVCSHFHTCMAARGPLDDGPCMLVGVVAPVLLLGLQAGSGAIPLPPSPRVYSSLHAVCWSLSSVSCSFRIWVVLMSLTYSTRRREELLGLGDCVWQWFVPVVLCRPGGLALPPCLHGRFPPVQHMSFQSLESLIGLCDFISWMCRLIAFMSSASLCTMSRFCI